MKIYLAGTNGRRWAIEGYMQLYLASNHQKKYIDFDWKNCPVYILESFFYADEWIEKHIPYFKDFLLDSGAFTFMSSYNGEDINWDSYIERYVDFINRNKVKKYFELDIDKLIGYEKVLKIRKQLELRTNLQCIPVWHATRGFNEYKKLCDEYKYIAIGCSGKGNSMWTRKNPEVLKKLVDYAKSKDVKVHGLGYTHFEGLKYMGFHSVDSTAWTAGNRFGHIFKFDGKTIIKYQKSAGKRIADSRKAALNNFIEWVKFQQYMDLGG